MALDNANPVVFERSKERDVRPEDEDDDIADKFDSREVFGKLLFIRTQHFGITCQTA